MGSHPRIVWSELAAIPPNLSAWDDAIPVHEDYWRQIGLAGPVVGVHENILFVGGGANFPEPGKLPNEQPALGKVTWDELFAYDLKPHKWLDACFRLPAALSYAATASTGKGVVVVGGEAYADGPNGALRLKPTPSAEAYLVRWDAATLQPSVEPLPSLPEPVVGATATCVGQSVYVQHKAAFLELKLDRPKGGWRILPRCPGGPREMAVAAAIGSKVVVATGRSRQQGQWFIHKDAYAFDIEQRTWSRLPDLPFAAMAGQAFGLDGRYFLIVGGDKDADRWNLLDRLTQERAAAVNNELKWQASNRALTFLFDHHTGFNTDLIAFDFVEGRWHQCGHFPGSPPVTTQPAVWRDNIILAGGEVRPGVRTPKVWIGATDATDHSGPHSYQAV